MHCVYELFKFVWNHHSFMLVTGGLMRRYPVSTRVNLVKNDDPDGVLEQSSR